MLPNGPIKYRIISKTDKYVQIEYTSFIEKARGETNDDNGVKYENTVMYSARHPALYEDQKIKFALPGDAENFDNLAVTIPIYYYNNYFIKLVEMFNSKYGFNTRSYLKIRRLP